MVYHCKKVSDAEQRLFDTYYQSILHNDAIFFAGCLLQRASKLFPTNVALICQGVSVTFQELYHHAVGVSKRLQDLGVKPRDRVCLLYENSIEFYYAYFGIWQTGAVVVPLNTYLHEKELLHIIKDAQPVALLISDTLRDKIRDIATDILPSVIDQAELTALIASAQQADEFEIFQLYPDEMAALLYTSGTTGVPKGVMLSSRNILTNIVQGLVLIPVTPADKIFGVLPLFHSFAQFICVWGSFFLGATVIVVPKIERRYILEGLTHKPTIIIGVPALFGLFCLLRAPLDNVRYFISGGDALPDKIRSAVELIYRRRLCNGYGMTETSPLIAANFDDQLLETNTVGQPAIGITCSIRDEDGNELAHGQTGILWVKGDNVMLGYYNDATSTRAILKDGWLNTGDCAYIDTQGRIVISGREKDIIKNKGFMIYPQEIENILLIHAAVLQVGVVGKPDEAVGEVPVAFIVLREPLAHAEKVLKALCAQHLATYKIPRQFIILEKMPLTALGKVDKKRLRKEYFS